jgi:hypothetical protein
MRVSIFVLAGLLVGSSLSLAQLRPTDEVIEQLRNEGDYGRRSLSSFDSDYAAYQRVDRIETAYGNYQSWDHLYDPKMDRFELDSSRRVDRPYFTRTGGVKRGDMLSADKIGQMYRDHYLLWADGLGNTLYESLKISSKYGLNHYFYAPDYDPYRHAPEGPELPFTDQMLEVYEGEFPGELEYMTKFLSEIQPLYYKDFLENPDQLWTLFTGIDSSPLGLFLVGVERDHQAVNEEFRGRYGFDLPWEYNPDDPEGVIQRIKMWEYIREQHGKVTGVRSDLFRDHVTDQGRLISNIHMATQVDYEWFGENFDHPGVAIRPMLSDNELVWKHYMGYGTRLINDLTDKLPVISPRINIPSAGARVVPTTQTIKYWYSQVVRNGAAGFYVWIKDYPAREGDDGAYGGFSYGHPDPSARGQERWEAALDMAATTSQSHVFTPPSSEFGILVNIEDADVREGWFDVFSAYIELTQADVWSTFISSTELREGSESLDRYEVLLVPKGEYVYQDVADQIRSFAEEGGTVLVTDPDAFSYTMEGESLLSYRESVLGAEEVEEYPSDQNQISLSEEYTGESISPYRTPYAVSPSSGAELETIGTFPNGQTAVTQNRIGDGTVLFAPGALADIYSREDDGSVDLDEGRADFYKMLEKSNDIEDKSWVWDVTVDNVSEITGSYDPKLPEVDDDIKFRWYMNPFLP